MQILLLSDDEWNTKLYDDVEALLDEKTFKQRKPKSIHGAFVAAHATVYHLVFKCQEKASCDNWNELVTLANKQMAYQELLIQCVSYGIAGILLVNPYGPEKEIPLMPNRCDSVL